MYEAATRERRWVAIVDDGRHLWIGRHRDPDEDELARVAEAMAMGGLAGWLAIAEGDYASRGPLSLLWVRPINGTKADFDDVKAAFLRLRREAVDRAS